jgi:site-specific DNA recombinase
MVVLEIQISEKSYYRVYDSGCLEKNDDGVQKVFGYARISSEHQLYNESITSQIRNIESNCKWKGTTLAYIFVDEGISGKDMESRPALKEMMKMIKKYYLKQDKMLNVYTCYLSRFTRSRDDMSEICKDFFKKQINLVAFDCPLDIRVESNHNMICMFAGNQEDARKAISKNVKNVMRELLEQDKLIFIKCPYGYIYAEGADGKKIKMENEREQRNIRKILEIWNNSGRIFAGNRIRNKMNELDDYYFKEDNKEWSVNVIDKILYNQKMSERVITNLVPIHMKDEKCREEIIKMINNGLHRIGSRTIAIKLDALCMFKHRISTRYVDKLLAEMGSDYVNQIEKNLEDYKENIRKIVTENAKSSYRIICNILNEKGVLSPRERKWTIMNLCNYCRNNKIYKNLLKNE